jgi:hypothetical protein
MVFREVFSKSLGTGCMVLANLAVGGKILNDVL